MDSMPVIEQAKGIVMAQHGCGPEEAFEVLRRMSQHTNVKLYVLAARLVKQTSAGRTTSAVPLISPDGRSHPRPETSARPPAAKSD
jgi:hypothetical protein